MSVQFYKCDLNALANVILRHAIPESAKTDPSTVKASKGRKELRMTYPPLDIQQTMRDVAQNSDMWHVFRAGSFGGSGHDSIAGYSHYTDNITIWFQESGRKSKRFGGDTVESFRPADLGHFLEPETLEIYAVVMGAKTYEVGMVLHPQFPFLHISPDGLAEFPPNVFHNIYTMNDCRRVLVEIKNPMYKLYLTKSGSRALVPAHYMLQLQAQLDCFNADAVDFVCSFRAKTDDSNCHPWPERDEVGDLTGRYICGETLITRVYRSTAAARSIMNCIRAHMNHLKKDDIFVPFKQGHKMQYQFRPAEKNEQFWLYYVVESDDNIIDVDGVTFETKSNIQQMRDNKRIDLDMKVMRFEPDEVEFDNATGLVTLTLNEEHESAFCMLCEESITLIGVYPPKKLKEEPFPDITIVPLKWVKFIITPPSGYMGCVDLKTNTLVGDIKPVVYSFHDQKPLRVKMHDMHSGEDAAIELECVPPMDPVLKLGQVANPIFKARMIETGKPVNEVIWDFMLEGLKDKKPLSQKRERSDEDVLEREKKHAKSV